MLRPPSIPRLVAPLPEQRAGAGRRPPNPVATSADVLEILTPIWHAKPPTARFVRMRICAVLEWAIAMDWRTDNPCDRLLPVLGPQHDVVEHRKALPHREVGAAIARVRRVDPDKVDTLAFDRAGAVWCAGTGCGVQ